MILTKLPSRAQVLQAITVAIADQQERLVLAGVQGNAVAGVEFPWLLARPAKGFDEIAVLVKLKDVIRPVAIGHKNRTIRPNGDGARLETLLVLVNAGLLRIMD